MLTALTLVIADPKHHETSINCMQNVPVVSECACVAIATGGCRVAMVDTDGWIVTATN